MIMATWILKAALCTGIDYVADALPESVAKYVGETKTYVEVAGGTAIDYTADEYNELQAESTAMSEGVLERAQRELNEEKQKPKSGEEVRDKVGAKVDKDTKTSKSKEVISSPSSNIDNRNDLLNHNYRVSYIEAKKATNFEDVMRLLTRDKEYLSPDPSKRREIVIHPKPDVIARIMVMQSWSGEGASGEDYDGEYRPIYTTSDFILENVNMQDAEKYQLIETFGENLIYFFGNRPKIYTFAGHLLNTLDLEWKNNFLSAYENYMRGTKCVENNARAYIIYEDSIIEGYILNISLALNSANTNFCPFNFSMYVTNALTINRLKWPQDNSDLDPQRTDSTIIKDRVESQARGK